MDPHEPDPLCDADPLARALAKLRPAPAGVDPQRLLFLAGRAARDRSVILWRRAFAVQAVVLVAFGCLAVLHFVRLAEIEGQTPPPAVRERVVYVDRQTGQRVPAPGTPTEPEEAPAPREAAPTAYPPAAEIARRSPNPEELAEYLRIRREVLTAGLGLLPDARHPPAAPASPADLERSLNLPPGVLTAPYRVSPPKPKPGDSQTDTPE